MQKATLDIIEIECDPLIEQENSDGTMEYIIPCTFIDKGKNKTKEQYLLTANQYGMLTYHMNTCRTSSIQKDKSIEIF